MISTATFADILRATAGTDMAPATSAIIVAAGNSTRMGKGVAKQFLEVDGAPVLARTLLAFEKSGYIDEIIVVAQAQHHADILDMCCKYDIKKPLKTVPGGDTRTESVKNGFNAISDKAKFVAIHDGARCLVTPAMIKKVLRAAYLHKAATAACPVTDTVKMATKRGFIEKTLDRDKVYLVQTPQVFHADLYRAALANAKEKSFTDDNQLIENVGIPVKLVDTGTENIKITHPEDIERAQMILESRRKRK